MMGLLAWSRRCSHATAESGAAEPSARMETMMRGSTAMVTGWSMTASSSRVSTPESLVKASSAAGWMRPVELATLVMGAMTVRSAGAGADAAGSFQTIVERATVVTPSMVADTETG